MQGSHPSILILTDEDDRSYDRGVFSVEGTNPGANGHLQTLILWDPEVASNVPGVWPLHDGTNNVDKAVTVVYVKQ